MISVSRTSAYGPIITPPENDDVKGNVIGRISVASLDNTVSLLQNITARGVVHGPIIYFDTSSYPITATLPIFAGTSAKPTFFDDVCNPLPDDTPDLSNL